MSEDNLQRLDDQFAAKKAMYAEMIGKTANEEKPAPIPLQKPGTGMLDAKLKDALAGISEGQIQIIMSIFNVTPSSQVTLHPKPLPANTGGSSASGGQEPPPVPADGAPNEFEKRDVVMNEGQLQLDAKKPRT